MKTLLQDNDITVFYITAKSFPDDALAAHQQLHQLIPYSTDRKYFGVSRPENGKIVYRAAAEEKYPGEGKKLNCDTLVLKKGQYISLTITDYAKDISAIQRAFDQLLRHPGIDPQGYCVEWFFNDKDVTCMIRLQDN
jgi:hypothetical protein